MGTDGIKRRGREVKEVKQKVQKTTKNRVKWAKFAGGGVGYCLTVFSHKEMASPDCQIIGCTWANGS
jgi:hypothetical protein